MAFAADDLTVPSLVSLLLRVAWIVVVVVFLAVRPGGSDQCGKALLAYLLLSLLSNFAGSGLDLKLWAASRSGTLLDDLPRRAVPQYTVYRCMFVAVDVVVACAGLGLAFTGQGLHCSSGPRHAFQGLVILNAVAVGWALCAVSFVWAASSKVLGPHSLVEYEEHVQHSSSVWSRRCRKVGFCCQVGGQGGTVADVLHSVGRVLAETFEGIERLGFTPSDLAAGLALVRLEQHHRAATSAQHGIGASVPVNFAVPDEAHAVADAKYYFKYASGVYGWMLYSFDNMCCCVCRLMPKCCGALCGSAPRIQGDTCSCNEAALGVVAVTSRADLLYASFANRVYSTPFAVAVDRERRALVVAVRGTLSMNDCITDALAVPLNVADDPRYLGAALDHPVDPQHVWVHGGFWRCAVSIAEELEQHNLLERVEGARPVHGGAGSMPKAPLLPGTGAGGPPPLGPLQLILCGHSLGAGVASVLALILKARFPHVKCYAFAPPGATMSVQLATAVSSFVSSVVVGKDMVPRLSLPAIHALLGDVVSVHVRAKVSKARVLRSSVGEVLCKAKVPPLHAVLHPNEGAVPPARLRDVYLQVLAEVRARNQLAASFAGRAAFTDVGGGEAAAEPEGTGAPSPTPVPAPSTAASYRHMSLPGVRVLHLVRHRSAVAARGRSTLCCKAKKLYAAVWAPAASFQGIVCAGTMVSDHLPGTMGAAFQSLPTPLL